jgi:SEC-C motif-containing protein
MKKAAPDCPCGSGARYAGCCRPYHQGGEPPDAEALMRSRFAAYALGEVDYLWRTLHADHPGRQAGPEAAAAEIRAARQVLRYVRLRVLDRDAAPAGASARVLFHAEIYERGRERSFLELSLFLREPAGWRYRSGDLRPCRAGEIPAAGLTVATWERIPLPGRPSEGIRHGEEE